MTNIAFDIDDTLYKVKRALFRGEVIYLGQIPDYEIIDLLIGLSKIKGNNIYIWSGGGVDYAERFVDKFGLSLYKVKIIPKGFESAKTYNIDITFDDEKITLGKVNIQIQREKYNEES